jgi:hypothetical protein
MSYYHINFRELIRMLLPVRLRKTIMQRWLLALTRPVSDLYDRFIQNKQNNIYTLSHNSQVVYLQAVLNDVFDYADRRIYIADDFSADPLYVFLPAESHPLWLGVTGEPSSAAYQVPAWLYTRTETEYVGYNFVIMVPAAITIDMVRLRALVDKYRLPSRNQYTVSFY